MDLGAIVLGALTLYVGMNSVKKGSAQVLRGLGYATEVARPDMRQPSDLPLIHQGARKQTSAGPMQMTRREIRNLDDRMLQIAALARKGKFEPEVIAWVRRGLSGKCRSGNNGTQWCVPEKDTRAEIAQIFRMMRTDVRYTSDILGADTYSNPKHTLAMRAGDCDDYAALGCAALMAVGIPCRFKVIRTKDANDWNHIYIQANTAKDGSGKWVSLDASVPVQPGWEAPESQVAAARVFPV